MMSIDRNQPRFTPEEVAAFDEIVKGMDEEVGKVFSFRGIKSTNGGLLPFIVEVCMGCGKGKGGKRKGGKK